MTTFNIISIGDVEFLGRVLNSVAMVCGTGDFKQLCICGFIIGLLFIGFQCIFQGAQRINLQHTFTCFICYMLFFGPSCTVVIEDAGSSSYVRTVDNVPIGVGVAGTAISGIGYGLTKMMEQAYGTLDGGRNGGYIEPLKIIAGLRYAGSTDAIWASLDAQCGAGCKTKESVINYISECTAEAIQLGTKTPNEIYSQDLKNDGIAILKSNSETLMTKLTLFEGGAIVGENGAMTCKDGWPKLKTLVLDKLKTEQTALVFNQLLGIKELSNTGKKVVKDWSAISNAVSALGFTADDAQAWILASVVQPVYEQGIIKHYQSYQDYSMANEVNSAIRQRNIQWASEQTMFVSVCRAMMSFFEGFVYAITPIIGFMLMIGAFGLGLIGKYFMVLAWIQLWIPCMSICNLYTITGLRSELTTAPIAGASSFYAMSDTYTRVSSWVATGGMLFAATPMLALFVISGSMYAFTTLASRLQGQDHFNEKNIAPDVQQVGAISSTAPMNMNDPTSGSRRTGWDAVQPTFSVQSLGSMVAAHQHDLANAAVDNMNKQFVTASNDSRNFAALKSHSEDQARSALASRVNGTETLDSVLSNSGVFGNLDASEKAETFGGVNMTADAGLAAGGHYSTDLFRHGPNKGSLEGAQEQLQAANDLIKAQGLEGKVKSSIVRGNDGKYGVRLEGVAKEDSAKAKEIFDKTYQGTAPKTGFNRGIEAGAKAGVSVGSKDSQSSSGTHSTKFSSAEDVSKGESLKAMINKAKQTASRNIDQDSFSKTLSLSKSTALSDSIQKAATETYRANQTSQVVSSVGSEQRIGALQLSKSLLNAGGLNFARDFKHNLMYSDKDGYKKISEWEDYNNRVGGMGNDQALVAAVATYMEKGLGNRAQASEFGHLLEHAELPLMFSVPKEVEEKELWKPRQFDEEKDKAEKVLTQTARDIDQKEGTIEMLHLTGGYKSDGLYERSLPDVDKKYEADANDVRVKFGGDQYAAFHDTREEAIKGVLNPPPGGTLVHGASQFDNLLNNFGKNLKNWFFGDKYHSPTQNGSPQLTPENYYKFKSDLDERATLVGLTPNETKLIDSAFKYQLAKEDMSNGVLGRKETLAQYEKEFHASAEQLKLNVAEDIYKHRGFKWDGSMKIDQAHEKVNDEVYNVTGHMIDHLKQAMKDSTSASANTVKLYNLAMNRTGALKTKYTENPEPKIKEPQPKSVDMRNNASGVEVASIPTVDMRPGSSGTSTVKPIKVAANK